MPKQPKGKFLGNSSLKSDTEENTDREDPIFMS
jgi:hypothetical protein